MQILYQIAVIFIFAFYSGTYVFID